VIATIPAYSDAPVLRAGIFTVKGIRRAGPFRVLAVVVDPSDVDLLRVRLATARVMVHRGDRGRRL